MKRDEWLKGTTAIRSSRYFATRLSAHIKKTEEDLRPPPGYMAPLYLDEQGRPI